MLPAWPMRVACSFFEGWEDDAGGAAPPPGPPSPPFAALRAAVGVFYNATGVAACFDPGAGSGSGATDEDGDLWGYQACTEMWMPMWRDGVNDMFYESPWDERGATKACREAYGAVPKPFWADVEFGGRHLAALTNVVFTNGGYDPWSGGGVLADVSPTAVALTIPEGGHHLVRPGAGSVAPALTAAPASAWPAARSQPSTPTPTRQDLMFANDADPPSVVAVREKQRAAMRAWIQEANEGRGRGVV